MDETDYAGAGVTAANVKGLLTITYPDALKHEYIDQSNPVLTSAGGFSFERPLRTDINGVVMQGEYIFLYQSYDGAVLWGSSTLTVDVEYVSPTGVVTNSIDLFTPQISITDATVYGKTGYTESVSRSLFYTAPAIITDTKTTISPTLNIAPGGSHYSTSYEAGLESTVTYQSDDYDWFSIVDYIEASLDFDVTQPLMLPEILALINCLLTKRNALSCCDDAEYQNITADYETLMSLYTQFINNGQAGITTNQTTILTEILSLLNKWSCGDDGTITDAVLAAYTWCLCTGTSGAGSREYYNAGDEAQIVADATGLTFAKAAGIGTFTGTAELFGGTITGTAGEAVYDRNGTTNSFKVVIPVKTANVGYATMIAALASVYNTSNNAAIADATPMTKDEGAVATHVTDIGSNTITLCFDSIGSIYSNWAIVFILP